MSVIVVLLAASKTFQHHSARVTRGCAIREATEKLQSSTVFSVSQGRRPSCQDLPGERRGTDCGLSQIIEHHYLSICSLRANSYSPATSAEECLRPRAQ